MKVSDLGDESDGSDERDGAQCLNDRQCRVLDHLVTVMAARAVAAAAKDGM